MVASGTVRNRGSGRFSVVFAGVGRGARTGIVMLARLASGWVVALMADSKDGAVRWLEINRAVYQLCEMMEPDWRVVVAQDYQVFVGPVTLHTGTVLLAEMSWAIEVVGWPIGDSYSTLGVSGDVPLGVRLASLQEGVLVCNPVVLYHVTRRASNALIDALKAQDEMPPPVP